jgi:hypothetical protein
VPARKLPVLDALPDTIDFRDIMYVPSLIEVPPASDLASYRKAKVPVLDQGTEGACTGFGLATVANYLLTARGKKALADQVSAWMLYTMAKRYDEWPGEKYSGSSARGAMKGWHKHGVCALRLWKDLKGNNADLNDKTAADAINRPLGAYFRVNHRELVSMHAALGEVGVLFATARVHSGWQRVKRGQKQIPYVDDEIGGHAFAIVGYDRDGLWIQNSWGPTWGDGGLARLSYADWLANGTDVWVAALGAPVELGGGRAAATMHSGSRQTYQGYVYSQLRPYIITSRNDGELDDKGTYGLTPAALQDLIGRQLPAKMAQWADKRVLLYAHGGLVSEDSAVQHAANNLAPALANHVYPLFFVWRSDAWTTIRNILSQAIAGRRDEGLLDSAKDFMLDRLDDMLEPVARELGGKAMWDEMKQNAQRATTTERGAAHLAADALAGLHAGGKLDELHLAGYSAGAIFMAYLADYLVSKGVTIKSLSLWAPAMTIELFQSTFQRLIESKAIAAFDLYTLDDATERDDDCAGIYHKSLLYLVSHAFERTPRIPLTKLQGTPLLGLERDAKALPNSIWRGGGKWYVAPGAPQSKARHHGDFDNDRKTLESTLRRISGAAPPAELQPRIHSRESVAQRRREVDIAASLVR